MVQISLQDGESDRIEDLLGSLLVALGEGDVTYSHQEHIFSDKDFKDCIGISSIGEWIKPK